MQYRPEIDGLRAVAVLPVILFHAGLSVFSGGFVGVDVFFVISGYLITTILHDELGRGSFSILNFYERRARRLLPALFFVLLVCLPLAWWLLLPGDLQAFGQSLLAVTVFSSNLLFWRTSDYFDGASELKPLLHTWSLAVEEHFYVLFPLLLAFVWRWRRVVVLSILVALTLASLALAQHLADLRPAANFYLLPSRAWELLAGALAAMALAAGWPQRAPVLAARAASWAGLALLVLSMVVISKDTPFPSLWTLLPVGGAVLLVLFARQDQGVGRWLSVAPLVKIGLISYSAYLWHQPLFAFARHANGDEPLPIVFAGLTAFTLLLAYFTWRFVEAPFRDRRRFSRRFIFTASVSGSLVLAGVGVWWTVCSQCEAQWLARADEPTRDLYAALHEASQVNDELARREGMMVDDGGCRFNANALTPPVVQRILACRAQHGPGHLIFGDSHAIDLYEVARLAPNSPKFLVGLTKVGCRPSLGIQGCFYEDLTDFLSDNSDLFSQAVFEQAGFYLTRTPVRQGGRDLFVSVPMSHEIKGLAPDSDQINRVAVYLAKLATQVPVVWFGPRVEPHITKSYVLKKGCSYPYKLRSGQREVFQALDDAISREVSAHTGIRFVSQVQMFGFDFPRDFITCGRVLWADGDHLSEDGERIFARRFTLFSMNP
jgi:peptidoglycan/LPS O-acetylase OafA/YrhL